MNHNQPINSRPAIVGKGLLIVASVISAISITGISAVALWGGPSSPMPEILESASSNYSILSTNAPSPKNQTSPESTEPPQSEDSVSGENSSSRNGRAYVPPGPNWTEAQRACQAQQEVMAAESNRVGRAANIAWDVYSSLLAELQATYGSNQWSAEDTARLEQANAELERSRAELDAFWAQYPWQQWGCNENGLWHVP